jgi:CheY-like chemotaxis protein
VNEVLADLEKLLQRILGEGLELLTVPGAELWPVKMDPGQVEQILANLAVNAKDAMQSGGRLTIATSNVVVGDSRATGLPPGRYVRLEVRDTGSGMTTETAARAFDPFFTTKPKGKGTGLGLSIVYGIVKQAAGDVKLRTAPGKGTCFEIYLPALEHGTSTTAALSFPAPESGRGQTILVVEDEDAVRMLAARILLRGGYKVLEARNAGEAILICERGEPLDLLLTDVVMPQMSGKGLAERLLRERPDLPVLYMSGHTDNALTSDGVLDATVRLLEKPFTRDSLLRSVATSLAHRRRRPLPIVPS